VTGDHSQRGDTDTGYSIRGRASRDVHTKFENLPFFSASWLLIVTWHNVTFYGAGSIPYPVRFTYHTDTDSNRSVATCCTCSSGACYVG